MWVDDVYFYSVKTLKVIAENYKTIYDGLPLYYEVHNPFKLAEFKADFDQALSAIGRGKWTGINGSKISNYRGFGKLQKVVIADIIGEYVTGNGGLAYRWMADFLNGVPFRGSQTRFISKPRSDVV